MPKEDINTKPFDEATLLKLDIFERYLEAWLPVFIMTPNCKELLICDFFAGSGYDALGNPGSPLRILRAVEKYQEHILSKRTRVRILLNERESDKAALLETIISNEKEEIKQKYEGRVSVECKSHEFQELFQAREEAFRMQPNLIFLDQYGAIQINDTIFQKLISLDRTDFLFFVSSSYLRRFAGEECFWEHFPDLDPDVLRNSRHEDIHRIILEYYRENIPSGNPMRLYPFSIKKGGNIYGLVFGSKHPLGVEKFLNIAWEQNTLNGEANFDIDDDIEKKQQPLFEEDKRLTKIEYFERNVMDFIKKNREPTNRDLYDYALANGHPPRHVQDIVSKLRKSGVVEYDGQVGFSYNKCYKEEKIKTIKVVR